MPLFIECREEEVYRSIFGTICPYYPFLYPYIGEPHHVHYAYKDSTKYPNVQVLLKEVSFLRDLAGE
jgi:hypothetical protein